MKRKGRHISDLYKKYLQGTASTEEFAQMVDYFRTHGFPPELDPVLMEEIIRETPELTEDLRALTDRVESRLIEAVHGQKQTVTRMLPRWMRYVAAAVLIVALGLPLYYLLQQKMVPEINHQIVDESIIEPARDRATILLSDGRKVILDGDREGIITDGQQILYHDGSSPILTLGQDVDIEFITVQTPRGGTYRVTLPDGTSVWLNAETTLKYPLQFDANERVVHLEGEAYFAVKRRSAKDVHNVGSTASADNYLPFRVISPTQAVEVLGTEFNVSAYTDEQGVRTTLVNGSVRVHPKDRDQHLVLYPGEQGLVDRSNLLKSKVDIDDYIDWKHGRFVFRNETAEGALRQIARWYNIDVEYNDPGIPLQERFSGTISRYDNLHTVLAIVQEAGGLDFEVQGRTVIVKKKQQNTINENQE